MKLYILIIKIFSICATNKTDFNYLIPLQNFNPSQTFAINRLCDETINSLIENLSDTFNTHYNDFKTILTDEFEVCNLEKTKNIKTLFNNISLPIEEIFKMEEVFKTALNDFDKKSLTIHNKLKAYIYLKSKTEENFESFNLCKESSDAKYKINEIVRDDNLKTYNPSNLYRNLNNETAHALNKLNLNQERDEYLKLLKFETIANKEITQSKMFNSLDECKNKIFKFIENNEDIILYKIEHSVFTDNKTAYRVATEYFKNTNEALRISVSEIINKVKIDLLGNLN